jgi:nicotinic acid mononucleotide adenylyltransferase
MGSDYQLVFGLSADPVHVGHVEMVAQSAQGLVARGYPLVEVLLVPVYRRNPVGADKRGLPDTFASRLTMCALAAGEVAHRLERRLPAACARPRIGASTIEAELARHRRRPNYTVETLTLLKLRCPPGRGLIFLISSELVAGSDPQLGRWHRPDAILRVADIAVCPRPGYTPNRRFLSALARGGRRVIRLDEVATPDISATAVRACLDAGVSPLALARHGSLTPAIARYLSVRRASYISETTAGKGPSTSSRLTKCADSASSR